MEEKYLNYKQKSLNLQKGGLLLKDSNDDTREISELEHISNILKIVNDDELFDHTILYDKDYLLDHYILIDAEHKIITINLKDEVQYFFDLIKDEQFYTSRNYSRFLLKLYMIETYVSHDSYRDFVIFLQNTNMFFSDMLYILLSDKPIWMYTSSPYSVRDKQLKPYEIADIKTTTEIFTRTNELIKDLFDYLQTKVLQLYKYHSKFSQLQNLFASRSSGIKKLKSRVLITLIPQNSIRTQLSTDTFNKYDTTFVTESIISKQTEKILEEQFVFIYYSLINRSQFTFCNDNRLLLCYINLHYKYNPEVTVLLKYFIFYIINCISLISNMLQTFKLVRIYFTGDHDLLHKPANFDKLKEKIKAYIDHCECDVTFTHSRDDKLFLLTVTLKKYTLSTVEFPDKDDYFTKEYVSEIADEIVSGDVVNLPDINNYESKLFIDHIDQSSPQKNARIKTTMNIYDSIVNMSRTTTKKCFLAAYKESLTSLHKIITHKSTFKNLNALRRCLIKIIVMLHQLDDLRYPNLLNNYFYFYIIFIEKFILILTNSKKLVAYLLTKLQDEISWSVRDAKSYEKKNRKYIKHLLNLFSNTLLKYLNPDNLDMLTSIFNYVLSHYYILLRLFKEESLDFEIFVKLIFSRMLLVDTNKTFNLVSVNQLKYAVVITKMNEFIENLNNIRLDYITSAIDTLVETIDNNKKVTNSIYKSSDYTGDDIDDNDTDEETLYPKNLVYGQPVVNKSQPLVPFINFNSMPTTPQVLLVGVPSNQMQSTINSMINTATVNGANVVYQ